MNRRKFLKNTAWIAALSSISPSLLAQPLFNNYELATLPAAAQQIRHGLLQTQAPVQIFKQCSWLHNLSSNQFWPTGLSQNEQVLTHHHFELEGLQFQLAVQGDKIWLTNNKNDQVLTQQIPCEQHFEGYSLRVEAIDWQRFHSDLPAQEWVVMPLRGNLQLAGQSLAEGQALYGKGRLPAVSAAGSAQVLLITKS